MRRTSTSSGRLANRSTCSRAAHRRERAAVHRRRAVQAQALQVQRRRIALVLVEAVLRVLGVQAHQLGVARGLGQDRGGRNRVALVVAFDDGVGAHVISGQRLPSIRASVGTVCSASTARRIASMVACRMLRVSISSHEHSAIAQASAYSRICGASSSRRASVSFFELRRPSIGRFGSRMTAAANTGPASGPRPASSTPQTMSSRERASRGGLGRGRS